MKSTLGLLCLFASTISYAAQTVTLDDGRQIQLNDDFTWHYISQLETSNDQQIAAAVIATPSIPVIDRKVATVVELNSSKPVMQLSDSGVDVLLGAAQYDSGQLIIPTSITNQSSQSVVLVELEVEILDESGKVIVKQPYKIWSAIKRLADTYLRPQQAIQAKPIVIDVEQAEQYQLNARIVTIETR
ncbi:ribonuclease [Vibrio galatheae]|uniref:Ribonuclease n=1 Tax=Vibrio galatheae TaxID=579748 RepID=A0A0F4NH98_9VIBR|nr:DUF3157 family protein [Vibrio galatheae]KJY82490.1 ribonuclease [Vibrio galatheae]